MAVGLKKNEPNGRDVYPDIIDHPHWQSPTRPHMSLYNRSAQFSAFDALAGYSDMVKETQRETAERKHPEEYELMLLNQKISLIADAIRSGTYPVISISYFVPDERKSGGKYVTVTEPVRRIDTINRKLVLNRKEGISGSFAAIDMDQVISLSGDLVDYLDNAFD